MPSTSKQESLIVRPADKGGYTVWEFSYHQHREWGLLFAGTLNECLDFIKLVYTPVYIIPEGAVVLHD